MCSNLLLTLSLCYLLFCQAHDVIWREVEGDFYGFFKEQVQYKKATILCISYGTQLYEPKGTSENYMLCTYNCINYISHTEMHLLGNMPKVLYFKNSYLYLL